MPWQGKDTPSSRTPRRLGLDQAELYHHRLHNMRLLCDRTEKKNPSMKRLLHYFIDLHNGKQRSETNKMKLEIIII